MNDYLQMSRILSYIGQHAEIQPSLEDLARVAGISPWHFQRKFTRWVGISPKAYLQCLTLENARAFLQQGKSVMAASLETGLSGPGRLHDLCIKLDAASPGEIKHGGEGLEISYGFGTTPFGECLAGTSPRGICYLAFTDTDSHVEEVKKLYQLWPAASFQERKTRVRQLIKEIFNPSLRTGAASLRAYVPSTRFQALVWRALINIPQGKTVSYQDLAEIIHHPRSARAVGNAVAANQLAYLIPCHRVIRQSGIIGNYRWGSQRKKAMLVYEWARSLRT